VEKKRIRDRRFHPMAKRPKKKTKGTIIRCWDKDPNFVPGAWTITFGPLLRPTNAKPEGWRPVIPPDPDDKIKP
jgi:hypothetical protein